MSAARASSAANRNERSNDDVAARSSWSFSCVLELLQRRLLALAGIDARERAVDVGQASRLAADVGRDAPREIDLGERIDASVQHQLGALGRGAVALLVEVADEHGRQQEQPEHDARVTRGDREAAVDRRRRPTLHRRLGQRSQRQREAEADEQLRQQRPLPARARQQTERGDAARAEQRARCRAHARVGHAALERTRGERRGRHDRDDQRGGDRRHPPALDEQQHEQEEHRREPRRQQPQRDVGGDVRPAGSERLHSARRGRRRRAPG